jgi:multidrug efflux pump subunit AcrA (membrane-fusion protein)
VGTIRAKTSSAIQSKATGHITAIHVKEGDVVEAGQALLEIDDRDVMAQVQRAEAALREAQQSRQEVASSAQAALHAKSAAEASGSLALATYERYKGLVDKKAVSRQAFDEASSRWRGAEAETARANDMASSVQARSGEVEARVEQARAEVSAAKTALSYTKITAPFAGVVTRKSADIGDLAAPGAPLLELEDTQQYRLESLVDEAHVSGIHTGDSVTIALDALGGTVVTATVAELVPAADAASRTFVVKIDLPKDAKIRSGMFGRALFSGAQRSALTVPATAVVQQGQLTGVYVVGDDQIARLRLVTTGKRYGDVVEALSGLSVGERVVTNHTEQITDGCMVQNG